MHGEEEGMSIQDIQLPDELINRLQDNTRKEDEARWDDGDIAAELVDEFGPIFGKMLVRKRIAIEAGIGLSSVRQREEISRFWPLEVRAEFGSGEYEGFQVLTWSQWRAIKPARGLWLELARWAVESADEFGGRPAPVDAIIAKRRTDEGVQPPDWETKFLRMWDLCDEISAMPDAPEDIITAATAFQDDLEHWHEVAVKAKTDKKK